MKNIGILLVVLAFLLPTGIFAQMKEQERKVESFTKIDLRIAGNVYLKQGSSQKVLVKADEKDIEELITEVSGSMLVIRFEDWFKSHENVEIYIEMVNIEGIDVSGSGTVTSQGAIKADEIEFEISGSGNIVFDELMASSIENEISGSGKVFLNGSNTVDKMEIEISGSGKVMAFDMSVNNVEAEISGSGKVEITALKRLDAEISGSGKVYYKGSPIINAEISGSGKVVHEE